LSLSRLPICQTKLFLREIQKSDFVIDEMYSDSPMATLAAEAAFFGKPTIVGGYYATCLNDYYDKSVIPPTLFCHPDQVKEAVVKLIREEEYRKKLGDSAQQYVLKHWSPKSVASKFYQLITGVYPKEWLFDPYKIFYMNGYGLNEELLKEVVNSMISEGGIQSLQLRDKPELEKRFYELAQSLDKTS